MTQTTVNASAATLGAVFAYMFGEWSELLSFFVLVIGIDIVTGVMASLHEGKGLSSSVGAAGLKKKAMMFFAVILAHRMDILMDTAFIMDGAVYFYLANELVSIVENYGRMNLPLPDAVKRVISVLKDRGGNDEGQSK